MKKATQIRRQARQLFRLSVIDGMLDEDRVRQVVHQVLQSKRRGSLALLKQFQRLVMLDRAMHTAHIESAQALPADLRTRVQAGLTGTYGAGITTLFRQNSALIGGMRIRVGSDVYDGSVRAGLEALEKSF